MPALPKQVRPRGIIPRCDCFLRCGRRAVQARRQDAMPEHGQLDWDQFRSTRRLTAALRGWLLAAFIVLTIADARADSCPKVTDEIATDRPDVTNSSLVVPVGSFQSENGITLTSRDGGRTFDGTDSRWRLGIAPCLEVLADLQRSLKPVRT